MLRELLGCICSGHTILAAAAEQGVADVDSIEGNNCCLEQTAQCAAPAVM